MSHGQVQPEEEATQHHACGSTGGAPGPGLKAGRGGCCTCASATTVHSAQVAAATAAAKWQGPLPAAAKVPAIPAAKCTCGGRDEHEATVPYKQQAHASEDDSVAVSHTLREWTAEWGRQQLKGTGVGRNGGGSSSKGRGWAVWATMQLSLPYHGAELTRRAHCAGSQPPRVAWRSQGRAQPFEQVCPRPTRLASRPIGVDSAA